MVTKLKEECGNSYTQQVELLTAAALGPHSLALPSPPWPSLAVPGPPCHPARAPPGRT